MRRTDEQREDAFIARIAKQEYVAHRRELGETYKVIGARIGRSQERVRQMLEKRRRIIQGNARHCEHYILLVLQDILECPTTSR